MYPAMPGNFSITHLPPGRQRDLYCPALILVGAAQGGLQTLQRRPGEAWYWAETLPVEVEAVQWTRIAVDGQDARHLVVWGVKENEQNVLYYGMLSNAAE